MQLTTLQLVELYGGPGITSVIPSLNKPVYFLLIQPVLSVTTAFFPTFPTGPITFPLLSFPVILLFLNIVTLLIFTFAYPHIYSHLRKTWTELNEKEEHMVSTLRTMMDEALTNTQSLTLQAAHLHWRVLACVSATSSGLKELVRHMSYLQVRSVAATPPVLPSM